MDQPKSGQEESQLHALIGRKRVLVGCSCDSVTAMYAELAGNMGFDVVWADLEHGPATWHDAEGVCRACRATGALSLLRVASAERADVLHALETGADVVVVPMVESRETSEQVVRHGKYPPLGNRGFAGSTRAMRYGVGDKLESVRRLNRETHLFVQIETAAALERVHEIVSVDGITGGLVGPADLSFSLGRPLNFDAEFVEKFSGAFRAIRKAGKVAATAAAHPALIDAAIASGCQIIVCATEIVSMREHWGQVLAQMAAKIGKGG